MRLYFILLAFLGFSFQQLRGEETFILINGSTSEIIKEFGPNIEERVTPASTFKIALSLMGYDAGVLLDEQAPTWDFHEGYDDFLDSWKSSQTPLTWMTRSCFWYSKIIALQLGLEKIQLYLALFEYGNQDFSGGLGAPGSANPAAWVSSSFKVSPKEQVDFIKKMVRGDLPISNHALKMTKAIMFKEELSGGWTLYGKTGLGSTHSEDNEKIDVRWLIGWLEKDDRFFPFAYQLRRKEIDVAQRVSRVVQLLEMSKR